MRRNELFDDVKSRMCMGNGKVVGACRDFPDIGKRRLPLHLSVQRQKLCKEQ